MYIYIYIYTHTNISDVFASLANMYQSVNTLYVYFVGRDLASQSLTVSLVLDHTADSVFSARSHC